ncbi:response regulator [Desulfopila aestuarii]|uniref:histidine kinase n=1 Tax=Desulfopila aestuarii DSM 18488 TaxID=1121416 RepID=A0A1M7Y2E3_9BACT|nr:response regulator [Desulfopila aestuarii]SHO45933.1 PAS domain S-box-containing protein [Desulfopila aestuarii DSM 18488]
MAVKALVVDNNPVLVRAISAFLEQEGCEVRTAPNGLEALNLLKIYTPDILFTDLVMPLIGGEQLCKIIRSSPALQRIFLVVVSGIVLEDFENIFAEKYYDLCIAKGSLKELRAHVQDALVRLAERQIDSEGQPQKGITRIPDGLKVSSVAVELLSDKRHLRRILENLEEGIVELDSSGVVISLNAAALRILEVQEERLIGSSFHELDWGDHQKEIREWLGSQLPDAVGLPMDIHEDRPIRIGDRAVTASFVPVREPGASFGLCILRDITRQYLAEEHERELNEAIKLVTKMEAMTCMAGGIAHDFNNLLTVICGNLDMLTHIEKKVMDGDRKSLLEHARSAAYMAVDLTRKISNSSPFGIVSRQRLVLDEIIENTVRRFEREKGGSVELEFDTNRSIVNINPDQISAALANILQNGLEADGQNPLKVTLKNVDYAAPVILSGQYVPAGRYVCIAVHDSGCGIAAENLLKIFDPYFSSKVRGSSKGMGLGLTVVYATLRNHGGYVVVDSELLKGTTVSCYLPRYEKDERHGQNWADKNRNVGVMLIENDPQMQEVGRIMLVHLGYPVTIANNLQEGVEKLAEATDSKESVVRIVLIDPSQQRNDDHHVICKELKGSRSDLKIIVTSSGVLDAAMSDFASFGYSNALPKPYSMDSLRHILASVLED